MKKLLSILLTLALCLGLMPAVAVPVHAAEAYDLYIAGVQVTSENASNLSKIEGVDVAEGGKAFFNPATNTLTLENVTIGGAGYPDWRSNNAVITIAKKDPGIKQLTIDFSGDNQIKCEFEGTSGLPYYNGICGVYTDFIFNGAADATLTVSGRLTMSPTPENGALCCGSITLNGGTVLCQAPEEECANPYDTNPYGIGMNNSSGVTLTVNDGKFISKAFRPLPEFSASKLAENTSLRGSVNYDGTSLEPYDFTAQKSYRYVIAEHAATTVPYALYIAGTQVTSANASDLSVIDGITVASGGEAKYDDATKTLTLNGATITNSNANPGTVFASNIGVFYADSEDLTVSLTGKNTITTAPITVTGGNVYSTNSGFHSQGQGTAVMFTGDGSLDVRSGESIANSYGESVAISVAGPVTIDAATTISATADNASRQCRGFYAYGMITVNGSLTAVGGNSQSSYGIYGQNNMTVAGSAVVNATAGNATANNGAQSCAISCHEYDYGLLTVSGNSKVTATSGKAETGQSYGVLAKQVIAKDSAELTAAAGEAVKSSPNITTLSHGIDADMLTISDNAKVTATGGEVSGGESSYGVKLSQKATVSGGSLIAEGIGGDTCEYSRGLQTPGNSGYGLYITDGTVFLTGGPTKDGGYGFGFAGGDLSLTGGSLTAKTEAAEGSAIKTYGTYNVAVEPVMASTAADGTGAVDYVAANNDTYKWFQAPFDDQEIPTEPTQVAMPVLPEPAEFNDSMTITITCETEGATIYYTTGGAITLYEGAFDITETTTVEAYATKDGLDESEHVTAKYTKVDPTPTPSTGGGGGATTYPVTPAEAENGKITVSPKNAAEKATVTITVTPDEGYVLDKLTVKDKDGNEIEVTEKDGKYTFTMPASAIEIEATFKPDEGAAVDNFPFVDVPETSYFRKPVEWAVEKGITNGVSEDKYGPELSCTRAQVVTFLWITCGSEDAGIETGFDDVDVAAYYDKAVAWAVEKGITAGTSENEFSPDVTVTRAQFVTMLWVAQGKPEADGDMPFTDVPEDAYYAKAVAWAYENDITAGKSADSFAPDDPCTRAQIMTFLYNAYAE